LLIKPRRETSPEYLEWIRGMNCLVGIGCFGAVHPHHLERRGAGGSDFSAVPLCVLHHSQIHAIGEKMADERYLIDWWYAAHTLVVRWFSKGGE
jgi:hypothetical protein